MAIHGVDRKDLLDLYKMAIDEYRFEVNLSWEAVKFFTSLNIGILGFGISILGIEQLTPKYIAIPIFIIGIILSCLSINTRKQYRKYYLATILIKKRIEDGLNLNKVAISPTEVDQPSKGIENEEEWIREHMNPRGTVTSYHYLVLYAFIIAYSFGVFLSIILTVQICF